MDVSAKNSYKAVTKIILAYKQKNILCDFGSNKIKYKLKITVNELSSTLFLGEFIERS